MKGCEDSSEIISNSQLPESLVYQFPFQLISHIIIIQIFQKKKKEKNRIEKPKTKKKKTN